MLVSIVSFIVVMSILVFVHEFGHFIVAKRNHIIVDEFGFGFPPRVVTLGERDGTVYTINAIPFGGFVRLRGEDDPSEPGSFAAAPKLARLATLLAGPVMNLLLASVVFAILVGLTGVPSVSGVVVDEVSPDSPAAQAALQPGDHIIQIGGDRIVSLEDLQISTAAHSGEAVTYQIVRNNQTLPVTMTPRVHPPEGQGALGIKVASSPYRAATFWEAVQGGVRETWKTIQITFQIPANLIRTGRPIADAGFMGPVGIAAVTGQVVQTSIAVDSFLPILKFLATLSVALGLTNILPFPGLDGGRLLFVIIEAVRRRRIEPMQEGMVHLVGLGLLLVLVAVLTVHEIGALVGGTFPSITR